MRFIFFILALGFSAPGHTSCKNVPFTKDLLQSGDKFRALTRMKEFEFQNRKNKLGFICAREIISLYLETEEFQAAEQNLNNLERNYPHIESASFPLWRTEIAYLYGNYTESLERAKALPTLQQSSPVVYFSYHLNQGPNTGAPPPCTQVPCQQLDSLRNDPELAKRKSLTAATLLGIIPGAGQMYAGRWGAGIGSLILNSLLIGLTVYASQHGEPAAAVLSGVAGFTLYAGSIYAGYESARRCNEHQHRRFEEQARDIRIELTLPLP